MILKVLELWRAGGGGDHMISGGFIPLLFCVETLSSTFNSLDDVSFLLHVHDTEDILFIVRLITQTSKFSIIYSGAEVHEV